MSNRSVFEAIVHRTQALEANGFDTEEARRIAIETLNTMNRKPVQAGRAA